MNIYQMYADNGNKVGFIVRRWSWAFTYAVVTEVAGQTKGELPGPLPYLSGVHYTGRMVLCDIYSADGLLRKRHEELQNPGTCGYHVVDFASEEFFPKSGICQFGKPPREGEWLGVQ